MEWLAEGIEGCSVILDPSLAKSILDWAPGNLAAMDDHHADELVDVGVVNLLAARLGDTTGADW